LHCRKIINDVKGLKQALADLQNGLSWVERLDVTVAPIPPPKPLAEQLGDNPDDLSGEGVHDDFKREMKFHRQAQAAVLEGLPKLKAVRIGTRRPEDYFAEMAKTDQHMKKVREKLLAKQIGLERSEKAKKLRELRKYGKKVQQEVLLKRQKEKREMADAIKKYRKGGKQDKLDFLDDKSQNERPKGARGQSQKEVFQPNKKRQNKNQKYGFGGQKKRSKYNTKDSADDVSGFSMRKHSTAPGKGRPGNKNKKRPGKMRRQKNKK
jgi:rRNA-processing protein EBP2